MNPTIHATGFRRMRAIVLSGVIASSVAALPAAQAENFDTPQVTVKFGDLDISHPHGAAVLYSRIKAAAETVCAPYWATGFAARVSGYDCVHSAIAEAVTAVDQPALSQVYGAKTRAPHTLRSAASR
jgi:UrcA family protein